MEGGEEKQFEGCRRIYIFDFMKRKHYYYYYFCIIFALNCANFIAFPLLKSSLYVYFLYFIIFAHSFHSPSFLPPSSHFSSFKHSFNFLIFFVASSYKWVHSYVTHSTLISLHLPPARSHTEST